MKYCELCKGLAKMYCESDNASLCYDCDAKVHSANFLAARHSRALLCQVCQSPTAWSAAGAKLGMSVSVCERCMDGYYHRDEVDESESVNENEEIDEDNIQVVPPPPASSSSSSDNSLNGRRNVSLKRMHEDDEDLHSDDDSGRLLCDRKLRTSPPVKAVHGGEKFVDCKRKRKRAKIQRIEVGRVTAGPMMEFMRRNNRQRMSSIDELCRLSEDARTVDLESSETS